MIFLALGLTDDLVYLGFWKAKPRKTRAFALVLGVFFLWVSLGTFSGGGQLVFFKFCFLGDFETICFSKVFKGDTLLFGSFWDMFCFGPYILRPLMDVLFFSRFPFGKPP